MTGRTIPIRGSEDVMAMFGTPGTFYRGKWQDIKVTKISEDEDTPLSIRKSLVELVIPTIFSKEQIEKQTGAKFPISTGSRLAYSSDVIEILKSNKKYEEAKQLESISPDSLDMYVIEKEIYSLV